MAGEKRGADASDEVLHQESAILLDVEGTTTSISFVQDTLFPYVREFLKKHVDEKWDAEEFKADLAKLKEQAKEDEEKKVQGFVPISDENDDAAKESLIKNVLWQMDNDRKTGALKQLQGHMWKAAHKPIKGHVYDDVPKAFEDWTSNGKKLYIYSSGSVEAQKLLFADTEHGDLLKYISGHFDTEVGAKQQEDSYKNILKKIELEPANVLFLTDVVKEAEAAKAAGLSTAIVIREGNAKLSDEDKIAFKTIHSFAELSFQKTSKRQKLEDKSPEEKKNADESNVAPSSNGVAPEPMDTKENVEETDNKKVEETSVDEKVVVEPNVETVVEKAETEKSEKEITSIAEKMETEENADEKVEFSKKEVGADDDIKQTEKTDEIMKETDKLPEKLESTTNNVEKAEKDVKETEKVVKVDEEVEVKEKEETTKSEDVKESETKDLSEIKVDDATDSCENKENEQSTEKTAKVNENIEVEIADAKETKEVENEKDLPVAKSDVEKSTDKENINGTTTNGDSESKEIKEVHSNGVHEDSEKAKENGDTEEPMKTKKAVADGAGDPEVVKAPVVAATS